MDAGQRPEQAERLAYPDQGALTSAPLLFQNVNAYGGFAYGVIGADIHILGTGTPLYVLEDHQRAAQPDSVWLAEVPSRMLNARFAVVDFTGRTIELTDLHAWRTGAGSRLAARWLHGPGGQGKTRLADQFAAAAAAAGWKAMTATHGPGAAISPPGSQDLRLKNCAGLLLVVDYADRWPISHLKWLLSNAVLHQVGVPTRILMLARTPTCPPPICKTLSDLQASLSHQPLPVLPADAGDRVRMFTAARDGFAAHYPGADVSAVDPPVSLDHPDLGLTLAIHMAALVAVDAHVGSRPLPADASGLTRYLLAREHDHWDRLYAHRTHDGQPTGLDYESPPSVMAQAVFTAALTGPVDHPAGKAILAGLDLEIRPGRVLTDHARCYPPTDPTRVLEPLYPDRLAEDYLALATPGHSTDHPSHPWAPTTAAALLTRDNERGAPAWTPRAVTFLAAAAQRWPHLGHVAVYPLVRADPQLAIDAGGAALAALAEAGHTPVDVLEAIEPLLPVDRHVDLDIAAAAIVNALITHRLAHNTDPAARADLYATLAWRLANAGYREQALAPSHEAVTIRRQLAEANPAAYLPDLAGSLISLGIRLSEVGRPEDALAASQEAADLHRELAEANPAAYLPDLASSLNNLGALLAGAGRPQEALAPRPPTCTGS